jgi:hypothetical protein
MILSSERASSPGMRSAIRVLVAVVFVGFPVVFVAVVAVGWRRSGEPPDWSYHLWPLVALGQFIGGLAIAMVGGIALGMRRWPDRVWPHLLQLWGAGLIVESVLQMVFLVASAIPTDEIDGAYVVDRAPFLWTVAVLALVVTPALVAWQTSVVIRAHLTRRVLRPASPRVALSRTRPAGWREGRLPASRAAKDLRAGDLAAARQGWAPADAFHTRTAGSSAASTAGSAESERPRTRCRPAPRTPFSSERPDAIQFHEASRHGRA